MGAACTSIYSNKGDKSTEDCQEWCSASKIGHCRYCKCRGCKHCHGDLSLPDWILSERPDGSNQNLQCKHYGLCNLVTAKEPLCLSVWRGLLHAGAPLVWSRCRDDVTAHQQWLPRSVRFLDAPGTAQLGEEFLLSISPTAVMGAPQEPLCVAAPVAAALLASPSG